MNTENPLFFKRLPLHGRLRAMLPYCAVFALAMILRLIYLSEIRDEPFFSILIGDAESYDAWAQEIVSKGWIGSRTFYQAPFYPYFLALVYTLGARDFMLVRMVQMVLGAFSCVLLARAGTYFFQRKAGWVAGVLLALYSTAIFFDLLIQKAVVAMFFMCALLCLMGRVAQRPSGPNTLPVWFLAGMVLACFGLTRENAMVLIPAVSIWMILTFYKLGLRWLLLSGLYLFMGLMTVFLPVTIRNYMVGGEFVMTTSQMGPNFYIGNSKDATGFYRPLLWDHSDWKFERADAQSLAEKSLGRKLTPNEVSDYWMAESIRHIRQNPLRWLGLLGKKWLLIWNAVEISDSESQYAHQRFSGLLNGLGYLFHFGTMCPLAVLGICLTWRNRRRLWGLYWVWFCLASSVVLFFIFDRYRYPMVAVMLLFAAAGLTSGYELTRASSLRPLLAGILVMLPLAVIINWPLVSKAKMEAPTHYNIGFELEKRNDLEGAKDFYIRSLSLDNTNPLVHNNLGMVAIKQDRLDDALSHFQASVAIRPDNWSARVNLGIVLWKMGRFSEAADQYKQVLKAEPNYDPALYYNIACFHSMENQTSQALQWLQQAIDHGFAKWDLIQSDPDLHNIRHLPEFSKILEQR